MAIVKANYQARREGKAAKAMGRAARYYTFREGADQSQRQWRSADGRELGYEQAREEIRAGAQTYGYSYRMVLSTKDANVEAEGYQQVLSGRFEKAYFIEHGNTDFPHAHVIGFTKAILKRDELKQMRGQLVELERTKARELGPDHDQAAGQQADRVRSTRRMDLDLDR